MKSARGVLRLPLTQLTQGLHLGHDIQQMEIKMHCQMCSKEMPFKNRNSDEDYFEAVEALGKGYFFQRT